MEMFDESKTDRGNPSLQSYWFTKSTKGDRAWWQIFPRQLADFAWLRRGDCQTTMPARCHVSSLRTGDFVNSFRGTLLRPQTGTLAKIPIYATNADRDALRAACRFNAEV